MIFPKQNQKDNPILPYAATPKIASTEKEYNS